MIGISELELVLSTVLNNNCSFEQTLRANESGRIWISSGDPDPSLTTIRSSDLPPLAKARAREILREARDTGIELAEDVGIAGDGGLIMEFAGPGSRDVMITVAPASWTYFTAAEGGQQTSAGILREDGIKTAVTWVAGLRSDLRGPGVISG